MPHEEVVLRVGSTSPILRTSGQGLQGPPGIVPGVTISRATFNNADADTETLGLVTHYAQVGTLTAPRVLTLSDATKALATATVPVAFLVIDESNSVTATNSITLVPESGTISGAASVAITVGGGEWEIYTDGNNWFAR